MRKISLLLLISAFTMTFASNIETSSIILTPADTVQQQNVQQTSPKENRWYYGGTVGFNFWGDYFYLSVNPLIGYKVSEKVSLGGKLQYVYINESYEGFDDVTSHNYGASIFSRYRPIPQFYLHAEFAYASIENHYYFPVSRNVTSERNWVPFLLLGGGIVQRLSANTSAYIEVLFDVIQDDNSPYEDWDPVVSIGVGVGF